MWISTAMPFGRAESWPRARKAKVRTQERVNHETIKGGVTDSEAWSCMDWEWRVLGKSE